MNFEREAGRQSFFLLIKEKLGEKNPENKKTKKNLRHRHDRPPLSRPARLLPRARGGHHPAFCPRGDLPLEGGGGGERSGSGSSSSTSGTDKNDLLLCRIRSPSPAARRRRPLAPLPAGRARFRGPEADRVIVVAQGRAPPRLSRRPPGPEGHREVEPAGRAAARAGGSRRRVGGSSPSVSLLVARGCLRFRGSGGPGALPFVLPRGEWGFFMEREKVLGSRRIRQRKKLSPLALFFSFSSSSLSLSLSLSLSPLYRQAT